MVDFAACGLFRGRGREGKGGLIQRVFLSSCFLSGKELRCLNFVVLVQRFSNSMYLAKKHISNPFRFHFSGSLMKNQPPNPCLPKKTLPLLLLPVYRAPLRPPKYPTNTRSASTPS